MCLIDKDQDGQFDHSVMVNGGSPAARMPHTIAPVGYTVQAAAPVGEGDVMRVIYKVGLFRFDIMMMEDGKERQFSSFTYTDATGRHSFGSEVYGHKNPDGTYSFDVPGFSFLSSDHDPANKSVLVSWHATHQPAIVPIPDEIGYRMR